MFGFLKEKLKSWVDKAKDSFKSKENEEKEIKKIKEEKQVKRKKDKEEKVDKQKKHEQAEKLEKEIKKEKRKTESKKERQITQEVISDIKKEKLEIETPEEKFEEVVKAEAEKEIEEQPKKLGFFGKLKKFFSYEITETEFEDVFSSLEMALLENNVAMEVVEKIKAQLKTELVGREIKKENLEKEIKSSLRESLEDILIQPEDVIKQIKEFKKKNSEPYKMLFFGINGVGKTTSIAKFASLCLKNKLSCILAAADTFRAASIEQIQIHADKLGVKLIKHDYGSDPSAVAFDAIKYAQQNKIDVVLIDTAGRMHTKENLLHEMEKISRVTKPNLKVFVAESIAGNDAIEQAKAFNDMVHLDGSILSKADIDEKGGAIISISYITKKPILYLGTGQKYENLELFDKEKFIKQLGL
jgi:fused signal recognition particle receptor